MKDSHVQGHQPKSCTHRKSMRVVTKGSVITQTSCGCGWPSATSLFSWSAVRLLVNTMICMIYSSESRQRWLYAFLAQLQLKAQVYWLDILQNSSSHQTDLSFYFMNISSCLLQKSLDFPNFLNPLTCFHGFNKTLLCFSPLFQPHPISWPAMKYSIFLLLFGHSIKLFPPLKTPWFSETKCTYEELLIPHPTS